MDVSTPAVPDSAKQLPKAPELAKLSASNQSRLRRRMSLLHYRRLQCSRSKKASDDVAASGSESTLNEEFSRCVSIADEPAKKRVKSDNDASSTTNSPNEVSLARSKSNGGFPDLPFEPVFRAGILILVTSPSGEVSLGSCDGEGGRWSWTIKRRFRGPRKSRETV
ncbi:hypothetical protein FQN51_002429 [Onygenales sp. PD_10]|nr:hypothetical protein FQN51_002429 [Onygenales sp. PD_10]